MPCGARHVPSRCGPCQGTSGAVLSTAKVVGCKSRFL